jgi:hypothetical protein
MSVVGCTGQVLRAPAVLLTAVFSFAQTHWHSDSWHAEYLCVCLTENKTRQRDKFPLALRHAATGINNLLTHEIYLINIARFNSYLKGKHAAFPLHTSGVRKTGIRCLFTETCKIHKTFCMQNIEFLT